MAIMVKLNLLKTNTLSSSVTGNPSSTTSTMFADHGIERMGFLLLGGPGETKESMEERLAA